jgi:hypothetical protein
VLHQGMIDDGQVGKGRHRARTRFRLAPRAL